MTEPVVQLERVTKRYDGVAALDHVSVTAQRGELLAVVGPSGCGKTTLLQVIAGLTDIDSGRVLIGGRVVAGDGAWTPPEHRRVGIVFQEHALFPHLTVADNVGFGLPRGPLRRARCAETLDLVHLGHLAARYPHELSGGEQQRVALARALAPRPAVVLLDEPFSSLDTNLRLRLRQETAAVLRASDATAIFVTHDRQEALSVGDRVAVLRDGAVEQVDHPAAVFHTPRTRFVATFVGEADLLAGDVRDGVAHTVVGALPVTGVDGDGPADVMIRPHEVVVDVGGDANATVAHSEFRGASVLHVLVLDAGGTLRCEVPHTTAVEQGTRVRVSVDASHPVAAFPASDRSTTAASPTDTVGAG